MISTGSSLLVALRIASDDLSTVSPAKQQSLFVLEAHKGVNLRLCLQRRRHCGFFPFALSDRVGERLANVGILRLDMRGKL